MTVAQKSSSRGQLPINKWLVVLIICAMVFGVFWWMYRHAKKQSATAQPEITRLEAETWSAKWGTEHGYRISYAFVTRSGQAVEGYDPHNTWYQPGTEVRVCYDPNNPSNNSLRSPTGADCDE